MTELEKLQDLQDLLDKIMDSDDLVARAETYFKEHHHDWSLGVRAYFQDFLERKKDQIHYEWYRVHQMGLVIATERAKSILEEPFFPEV